MQLPLVLALISLGLAGLAALSGGLGNGLSLVALCAMLAALLLALRDRGRGDRPRKTRGPHRTPRRLIAVDGSNLLYWRGDKPDLSTVAEVLRRLRDQQRHPLVWFDANVGYLVANRYLNAAEMAKMLKMDREDVTVAPKGEPADALILAMAQRQGLQVLSNDRFRDWHAAFPTITEPGRLLQGRLQDGRLRIEPAFAPKPEAPAGKPTSPLAVPGERRATSARPARLRPAASGTPPRREPRF